MEQCYAHIYTYIRIIYIRIGFTLDPNFTVEPFHPLTLYLYISICPSLSLSIYLSI